MAEETSFEPSSVNAVSQRINSSRNTYNAALQRLVSSCSQHDGCWGNDEFGASFSKGYLPGQQAMLKNGQDLDTGVGNFVTKLNQAVQALERTDEDNAASL